MPDFYDDFSVDIDPRWHQIQQGNSEITRRAGMLHLSINPAEDLNYSNAQISEYDSEKRDFQFEPPLRLTVKAFSSLHPVEMRGTAGFGFWNHPFVPGQKGFHLPQALWFFFAAPPNDIQLAKGVPGHGWKAASLNARTPLFRGMMFLIPLAMLMMRVPFLYRRLWSIGQRAMGVSEYLLDPELLTAQHTYTIEWQHDHATFAIDGETVHTAQHVPQDKLGFVAWIDNQYMIVTPQGKIESGLSMIERRQSLVLTELKIETLSDSA